MPKLFKSVVLVVIINVVEIFAGTISLISPIGGEVWDPTARPTRKITWSSTNSAGAASGTVTISYSMDGTSYTTIISNTEDDGEYIWTLPSAYSNKCIIKVSSSSGASDYSSSFTIDMPRISVTTITEGMKLYVGAPIKIKFDYLNHVDDSVYVKYSTNGGVNWTDIKTVGYKDSCDWIVPAPAAANGILKVMDKHCSDDVFCEVPYYTEIPANRAPTLTSATAQTTVKNTAITLTTAMTNAADPDGDALTLVVAAGSNYTVSGTKVTPAADFTGTLTVPVSVSDGKLTSSTVNMTITVTAPANRAPTLTSATAQTTAKNTAITLTTAMTNAADPDGDALTLVVGTGSNYTVSGTKVTPASDFTGTLTVPVSVSDGKLTSSTVNMTITVTAPANRAPTLTSATAQTTAKNTAITLTTAMTNAADPDGDALTLVVGTGSNYTVSGAKITPAADFTGTLTVPVSVSDGKLTSSTVNMTITVEKSTAVISKPTPATVKSLAAYPNPTTPGIEAVSLIVPEGISGQVHCVIYDLLGSVIDEQYLELGLGRSLEWDLKNLSGRSVGSGSYTVVVKLTDQTGKVTLMKTVIGVQR